MHQYFDSIRSSFMFKLISQILGIIFSVLITSFLLIGIIMANRMKDEINRSTILSFQKTESEIISLFDNAINTINYIYVSPEARNYLDINHQEGLTRVQTLIELQKMMKQYNIHFNLIGVVNDTFSTAILTDDEFLTFHRDDKGFEFLTPLLFPKNSSDLWCGGISLAPILSRELPYTDYIYITRRLHTSNAYSSGPYAIFVGITQEALAHTYQQIQSDNNFITIIDQEGYILSSNYSTHFGAKLSYYPILKKQQKSFDHTLDGIKYRIIPYQLNRFGWTIINQVPVKAYMSKVNETMYVIIVICVICFILITFLCYVQIKRIFQPFYALTQSMDNLALGDLTSRYSYSTEITELNFLGHVFNRMAGNISTLIANEKDYAEQKNKLRMQILIAQINPHFIHNTLNLIKWMAMIGGNHNITSMTQSLINILAPGFKNKNLSWSIREEVTFIEEYINILNIRFSGDIQFSFKADDCLFPYRIPRFIIQPLIENSITHGYQDNSPFLVHISLMNIDNYIDIKVIDNGVGFDESSIGPILNPRQDTPTLANDSTGIGLVNIKERLALFFKSNYVFEMCNHLPCGTYVHISIPKQNNTK